MAGDRSGEGARQLDGVRVLLVEDASLIAMWAQTTLEVAGAVVLGPAMRLPQALELARTEDFDLALLDIDLNGELAWPVADVLIERGVPFVFTTGYEGALAVPERLAGVRTLAKPYREEQLTATARSLLAK